MYARRPWANFDKTVELYSTLNTKYPTNPGNFSERCNKLLWAINHFLEEEYVLETIVGPEEHVHTLIQRGHVCMSKPLTQLRRNRRNVFDHTRQTLTLTRTPTAWEISRENSRNEDVMKMKKDTSAVRSKFATFLGSLLVSASYATKLHRWKEKRNNSVRYCTNQCVKGRPSNKLDFTNTAVLETKNLR